MLLKAWTWAFYINKHYWKYTVFVDEPNPLPRWIVSVRDQRQTQPSTPKRPKKQRGAWQLLQSKWHPVETGKNGRRHCSPRTPHPWTLTAIPVMKTCCLRKCIFFKKFSLPFLKGLKIISWFNELAFTRFSTALKNYVQ